MSTHSHINQTMEQNLSSKVESREITFTNYEPATDSEHQVHSASLTLLQQARQADYSDMGLLKSHGDYPRS